MDITYRVALSDRINKKNISNERLLLKRGRRLFLWHQFCSHTDEIRNGHGINFDAIDEKWLHFGATSSPA